MLKQWLVAACYSTAIPSALQHESQVINVNMIEMSMWYVAYDTRAHLNKAVVCRNVTLYFSLAPYRCESRRGQGHHQSNQHLRHIYISVFFISLALKYNLYSMFTV